MDNYEYKLRKNNSSEKKTTWICTQPGCKVRMMSREKLIRMKAVGHNHGPTYRGDYSNLKSQIVNIECTTESLGRKNPIIILNSYEYKMRTGNRSNKTLWICTYENKTRCKVRLLTYGKCIRIKAVEHNHAPTYTGNYKLLKSQVVNVEYTTERLTL